MHENSGRATEMAGMKKDVAPARCGLPERATEIAGMKKDVAPAGKACFGGATGME